MATKKKVLWQTPWPVHGPTKAVVGQSTFLLTVCFFVISLCKKITTLMPITKADLMAPRYHHILRLTCSDRCSRNSYRCPRGRTTTTTAATEKASILFFNERRKVMKHSTDSWSTGHFIFIRCHSSANGIDAHELPKYAEAHKTTSLAEVQSIQL